jgi:hypothetical protein
MKSQSEGGRYRRPLLLLVGWLLVAGALGYALRERSRRVAALLSLPRPKSAASLYPAPVLLSSAQIWSGARHNAFGDLIRWNNTWYACCREGSSRASADGVVRAGLRDAHFTETGDGGLLLNTAETTDAVKGRCQSVLFRSDDGRTWTGPVSYGDPDVWIWRLRGNQNALFGVGYSTRPEQRFLRLYRSEDRGRTWTAHHDPVTAGYPKETDLWVEPGGAVSLLVQRDSDGKPQPTTALWVTGITPYDQWVTENVGVRFASPCLVQLPDRRLLAAGRFYAPDRMSLGWLDPATPRLTECLPLVKGPDCGYPGAVYHHGILYLVYHVGKGKGAALYAAQVRVPPHAP